MIRSTRRALVLALLATSISACRLPAADDPRETYVLAILVQGPSIAEKTPEQRTAIQAAHLENIGRLARERKIVLAGPFGKPVPDERMRGIFVLATDDLVKARAWTGTDPAVKEGVLGMELAELRTEAPLRRALERDLAEEEERAKTGEESKIEDRIRGYAMVLARDPEKAALALTKLREQGRVLIEGKLHGSPRGAFFAVLDAESAEAAAELLGACREEIGEHDLASWWASKSLATVLGPAR